MLSRDLPGHAETIRHEAVAVGPERLLERHLDAAAVRERSGHALRVREARQGQHDGEAVQSSELLRDHIRAKQLLPLQREGRVKDPP